MTMRKVFGSTMLLSIVGAVLLGGAFAWKNSKSSSENTIAIGKVTWTMAYEQEPNIYLGPNDGVQRIIGDGAIANDPSSNFALRLTGGNVTIDHVIPTVCGVPAYFSGAVNPDDSSGLVNPGQGDLLGDDGGPGQLTAGQYHVLLGLDSTTPDTCAGATVAYIVTVNVTTAPAS